MIQSAKRLNKYSKRSRLVAYSLLMIWPIGMLMDLVTLNTTMGHLTCLTSISVVTNL